MQIDELKIIDEYLQRQIVVNTISYHYNVSKCIQWFQRGRLTKKLVAMRNYHATGSTLMDKLLQFVNS